MFDHIGIKVANVDPSVRFYTAALGRLGHGLCSRDDAGASFPRGRLEASGRDNGRPGLRTDYGPTYYAAFLLDPDGNNVEAVCLR
jgi:catechol 2,3-dioxygenase-like lactoylglutathione lyase family enzyme